MSYYEIFVIKLSLKSIFGLNSDLKSNLSELKKKRKINQRKIYAENLIALKGNKTKTDTIKVNKKTNKSILGPKNEDIIKDL